MQRLQKILSERFGDTPRQSAEHPALATHADRLCELAARGSHRRFRDEPVPFELLHTLAAVALAAPTKSDLQQRDIVIIQDPDQLSALKALVADQEWTRDIPALLIFCGNNRRQRQIHEMHGRPFANDHLDAFFNAAVDAGIALQAFITAAETVGLGCCPISAIRNQPEKASDLLALPPHVFPIAGLAVGWPAREGRASMRLPLSATVHTDRFDETGITDKIRSYDARRANAQPFRTQRATDRFGKLPAESYTWSEDKTRQYTFPEREGFGRFIVRKLFNLK